MFGYIAPVLNALSEEQQQAYRAAYCGVCHALSRKTGAAGRITLSNDMTFLALLLTSLYEPEEEACRGRCAVHPLAPRPFVRSAMVDYAADMNLLLTYYKCQDQWADDHALAGRAGLRWLKPTLSRIDTAWPRQSRVVAESLAALWAEEKQPQPSPDRLCNLSGEMLGEVFVPDEKDLWAAELRELGRGLGRFVFWMDAWEDYDADRKRHRFNPLTGFHDDEVEALIEELRFETDAAHRAELANQIVQTVIDANYFGFVGLFNKITVLAPGVSGLSENCPFDFYGIDANTTLG